LLQLVSTNEINNKNFRKYSANETTFNLTSFVRFLGTVDTVIS